MYQPMVTWAIIVCILILAFTLRAIEKVRKGSKPHKHFIEMGTERELFYCPGDRKPGDEDDIENL